MKTSLLLLIVSLTSTLLLSSCLAVPYMAYDYVTSENRRAELDNKYPEKNMTKEEIEAENRRLDAQGY